MSGLPIARPLASSTGERFPRPVPSPSSRVAGTVGTARGAIRLGPRRLSRTRDSLSERDLAVLGSVARLRLVTSRQLELLHYANAATPLTASRKARRALQRLVDLGLLRRLARQIGGVRAGSAAYVYALTDRGQRLLELPGPRKRAGEPAWPFVAHTLDIADVYVALHQVARSAEPHHLELLNLQTEPDSWRTWTSLGGGRLLLRPDLYLAAGVGDDELRWFIEVDRGTEHRPALLRKCRAYQAYYESGVEQDRDGIFPRVAWIVPDTARADLLQDIVGIDRGLTPQLFAAFPVAEVPQALFVADAN
jgi:hypothetical protein